MRVFMTGASGIIGRALIKELLEAGHTVLGLVRSDEAARRVTELGADVLRGSLTDLDVLKAGAASSDGVIHLAFIFDHNNFSQSCQIDRDAINAMADALAGSNRPMITTTATGMLPHGRLTTEDDVHDAGLGSFSLRGESEVLTKSLASKGIRTMVIRPSPSNHGDGDHQFMAMLIRNAREKGVSAYIGDGLNRWPAVHYIDTAVLYRLALEKGRAGATYHSVAEEGVRLKDIATIIGEKLGIPVVSKPQAEAMEHFGLLGILVGADNPVSSKKTREELGWTPKQYTLLEDLANGKYFAS